MPVESRTRITILLPAPSNLGQFLLLDKILTGLVRVCGGVTVSSRLPAVFDGVWIDENNQTIPDANVVIFADAPTPLQNLTAYLEQVKLHCQLDFNQDIVWVTTNPVERVTTHDPIP